MADNTKHTLEEFILASNKTHNGFYNYDKTEYINMKTKIIVTCPLHGDYYVDPFSHKSGTRCSKCADKTVKSIHIKPTQEFIKEATKIHEQNAFLYHNTVYDGAKREISIFCTKTHHGTFTTTPSNHLRQKFGGCKKCHDVFRLDNCFWNEEHYKDKKTTLYYFYLPAYNLWKIGITLKTVEHRYGKEIANGLRITRVITKTYEDGAKAFTLERDIKEKYQHKRYYGVDVLIGGNSELFTEDILRLDSE